jgi:hypothetical protein
MTADPARRPASDRVRSAGAAAVRTARGHWLFSLLVALGIALRIVATLAYRPALVFIDSIPYLNNSVHLSPKPLRPFGYPVLLRALSEAGGLSLIPFVQHVAALAVIVLLYATLLRLGVRRWMAALAAAPVLLDAMQLNLEHQIMSDVQFELFVACACCVLLWRPRPGIWAAGGAGLLLAAATLTRPVALIAILPAVLVLLFVRAGITRLAAMVGAFAVPLLIYAAWFHSIFGVYALTGYDGHFLYARVAPFANCAKFSVPAYQRPLCPTEPRLTVDGYMWSRRRSPIFDFSVPPSMRHGEQPWLYRSQAAGSFARQAILHQPLSYLRTVGHDFLRGFWPTRNTQPGEVSASRWKFQVDHPWRRPTLTYMQQHGDHPSVNRPLARFLESYQRVGYTPGPLLFAALVVGLLGAAGIGSARRSGLRSACFLFSVSAALMLIASIAVSQFSWRYQLPQLILLPAAAALGVTALMGGHRVEPAPADPGNHDPVPEPAAPAVA